VSYKITKYTKNLKVAWDTFVKQSKNGTFLFYRDYMDYHSDRFYDASLVVYNDKDKITAILPASKKDGCFYSHQGLTYGGLVVSKNIKQYKVLDIFREIINFICKENLKKIIYKPLPHIYHLRPAEEDIYALFRNKFKLFKREPSTTLNMLRDKIPSKKINGYKKAVKEGLLLNEVKCSKELFKIINKNLQAKYKLKPVHTYEEMNLLQSKFPSNIHFLQILKDNNILGGAILYLTNNVVHAQYITLSDEAKTLRGMDFLIASIVNLYKNNFIWFDFGISSENGGNYLNKSLCRQKEEFGASTVCYDTYIRELN